MRASLILLCLMVLVALSYAEEHRKDCQSDQKTGPCEAAIRRWYYDSKDKTCKEFIYGGCGGNGNNYESEKACEANCGKLDCQSDPETGPCEAAIKRWYYDSKDKMCKGFIYGGCGGNGNNYESEKACEAECGLPALGQNGFECKGGHRDECKTCGDCTDGQVCRKTRCGNRCEKYDEPDPEDPSPLTCANILCIFGQRCEMIEVCDRNGCESRPVCTVNHCPVPTSKGTCDERCGPDGKCPGGQLCCSNGCGHSCQDPVGPPSCQGFPCPKGQHCELVTVLCIRAPCYPVPECKPDEPSGPKCPVGNPLRNHYCGLGGEKCPIGYSCLTEPSDRYAICCPACPGIPSVLPKGQCSKCRSCPGDTYCTRGAGLSMCCLPVRG